MALGMLCAQPQGARAGRCEDVGTNGYVVDKPCLMSEPPVQLGWCRGYPSSVLQTARASPDSQIPTQRPWNHRWQRSQSSMKSSRPQCMVFSDPHGHATTSLSPVISGFGFLRWLGPTWRRGGETACGREGGGLGEGEVGRGGGVMNRPPYHTGRSSSSSVVSRSSSLSSISGSSLNFTRVSPPEPAGEGRAGGGGGGRVRVGGGEVRCNGWKRMAAAVTALVARLLGRRH